jgi:hypothetical protein
MGDGRVRLLRGQVVIRELDPSSDVLWLPTEDPKSRTVKTHRGVVLGMGEPSRLFDGAYAPKVPWGFEVGDVVQYHFTHNLEAHTRPWPPDGRDATWISQSMVDGVIEP